MNDKTCYDCKHRRIIETSHEWLECKCKRDDQWHNPTLGCAEHEREADNDE